MGNMSQEMKSQKSQKEILEIKNRQTSATTTEMINAFHGPVSRLDTAKEKSSQLEYMSVETYKIKKQREQTEKNKME